MLCWSRGGFTWQSFLVITLIVYQLIIDVYQIYLLRCQKFHNLNRTSIHARLGKVRKNIRFLPHLITQTKLVTQQVLVTKNTKTLYRTAQVAEQSYKY